ncbi:MAG: hypothetical protein JST00_14395 [Deltaproteobacteria bacterium]|nr:hypothetical protein [Deltaproteobacteria bacterium]
MHEEKSDLGELLSETRILLPGTEIFLAFLTTLPFTNRFDQLSKTEHGVYVCTFFATLVSFVLMVAPAAYHRVARPIHDKERFKNFANVLLVVGLVPISVSVVLTTFLVTSMVLGDRHAIWGAVAMGVVVAVLWWAVPLGRAHDRFPKTKGRA